MWCVPDGGPDRGASSCDRLVPISAFNSADIGPAGSPYLTAPRPTKAALVEPDDTTAELSERPGPACDSPI